ncbi:hypothetical protein [Clostridium sp. 2218st1_F5_2218SCRN_220325]|uniref:hypothetical protein n=1 Tax=Clostridium sp. 2218st1_F5_2218SCRN_220325 TaxID=3143056 RepID=UPI00319E136B
MTKLKECSYCGATNTSVVKGGSGVRCILYFLGFSVSIWIPILGWILAPFLFIGALISFFHTIFEKKSYSFFCNVCKRHFEQLDKDTYEQYKSQGI